MDALRTAKAALDDGLISQADYEQVKQAFLSSMTAGVGRGAGRGGGGGSVAPSDDGGGATAGAAEKFDDLALGGGDAGAAPPGATAKRTGSFGAIFGGGRKAAGE